MPIISCPVAGCTYKTDDVDAAIIVELLKLHSASHVQQTPATTAPNSSLEKIKRPTVSAGGTSEEWAYFKTRSNEYKESTKVSGRDCIIHLLECCDEELRKNITRLAGSSLLNKDEEQVLSAIQKLAVRVENVMVARVQLHEMQQDREEPVRTFCARLSGQANICKYNIDCPGCKRGLDYTDHIVRDCIIRGISDDDIRLDILGNENQDMTLDTLVGYIESKEAGKRSLSQLASFQSRNAARSQYKRSPTPSQDKPQEPAAKCQYCGISGHGNGSNTRVRREKCTAYGKAN